MTDPVRPEAIEAIRARQAQWESTGPRNQAWDDIDMLLAELDALRQQLAEANERNSGLKFDLDLFAAALGVQGRDDVDAAVTRQNATMNAANDRAAGAEAKLAEAEAESQRWNRHFLESEKARAEAEAEIARLKEKHAKEKVEEETQAKDELARSTNARSTLTTLASALSALVEKWREKEQRLAQQADGQHGTKYAEILGTRAETFGNCADDLAALLDSLKEGK